MRLKIIAGFGFIFLMLLVLWSFFGLELPEDQASDNQENKAISGNAGRAWFEADGVTLEEHLRGEKILVGSIESLRTRKKKIGFISFSLLRILEGRNVTIDLYESAKAGGDIKELRQRFVGLLLPGTSKQKAVSIGLADLTINFFREQAKQSTLHAAYSTIDSEANDIIFTGNVTLSSADRRLNCAEIKWDSANGRFLSKGNFFLLANDRVFKGHALNTDHLLQDISPSRQEATP